MCLIIALVVGIKVGLKPVAHSEIKTETKRRHSLETVLGLFQPYWRIFQHANEVLFRNVRRDLDR